ncbi:hypothetical protein F53441_11400 [Fusarium austroafricanum]|uniref:Uncharacterized protein n=1 Tax=Fusarium austroafricanum TaxID=2364996 RepID=A0A8H4K2M9_9HYPO|nr:hypothetical protein F53441_11400 [Fusarium austroafricanum]
MPAITSLVDSSTEARGSIFNSRPSLEQIQRRSEIFRRAGGPSIKMDALYIGTFAVVGAAVPFTACLCGFGEKVPRYDEVILHVASLELLFPFCIYSASNRIFGMDES